MMMLDCYQPEFVDELRFYRPGFYLPIQHQTMVGMVYLACDAVWRLKEYQQLAATQAGQDQLWIPGAPSTLAEQCAAIRKQGYGWGEDSFWPGTWRVVVPVYHAGVRPRRIAFTLGTISVGKELNAPLAAEQAKILLAQAAEFERKQ
jgi:DNA-binding IclR family transcriptional regulator